MKGDVGKRNGQMVGGRYHCIIVRSFDVIFGTTAAALWKDIRVTLERRARFIVGGKKNLITTIFKKIDLCLKSLFVQGIRSAVYFRLGLSMRFAEVEFSGK